MHRNKFEAMWVLLLLMLAVTPQHVFGLATKPNVILVLADDLSWNLVKHMPEVLKMQRDGVTFSKYFVANSLCCPSRASIFTGQYPHNTGVLTNARNDGGYTMYNKLGNEAKSFHLVLEEQGYKTAMLGKYLNLYNATLHKASPGWSTWSVVGSDGYKNFDYTMRQNSALVRYGKDASDYLTDVLARLAGSFITKSAASPFFVEVAPTAPHYPYIPAPRDARKFLDATVPRTPRFQAAVRKAPSWLSQVPLLAPNLVREADAAYRMRLQAVQAIDKAIGDLRALLVAKGLADDTYVIFTADNGYHTGEWRLSPGKMTAFDTDIRVPLIVVGPGVQRGKVIDEVVQNTDLCPTFAQLAGGKAVSADGRSILPLLRGQPVQQWRKVALIEHRGAQAAAALKAGTSSFDPDMMTVVTAGRLSANFADPPTYSALRGKNFVYVEYATGERQFHNLTSDPWELDNTYGLLSAAAKAKLTAAVSALKGCTGEACWSVRV